MTRVRKAAAWRLLLMIGVGIHAGSERGSVGFVLTVLFIFGLYAMSWGWHLECRGERQRERRAIADAIYAVAKGESCPPR